MVRLYTISYDFYGVQISGMSSLSWVSLILQNARLTFFDHMSGLVL